MVLGEPTAVTAIIIWLLHHKDFMGNYTMTTIIIWFLSLRRFNPLNAELNPICQLLALLGAHHILHVGRIRINGNYAVKAIIT